ncbi:MAG: hypothetical protein ABIZ04_09135 [Opitutus sp.]
MLSRLKKSSPEDSELELASWHPDFRNTARLPDTKAVRTSFLVNGIVLLIAAVAVTGFAFKVYELQDINTQVAHWQTQIDRDKAPSERAIALYKKFQTEAAHVADVNTFLKSRPVVSDVLLHLGKTLPDYVAIDRFDLGATNLNVRGTVRGAPDQASGRASSYLQQLKADPYFATLFSDISLLNLNRNTQAGGLILELSFKLKEAKKP